MILEAGLDQSVHLLGFVDVDRVSGCSQSSANPTKGSFGGLGLGAFVTVEVEASRLAFRGLRFESLPGTICRSLRLKQEPAPSLCRCGPPAEIDTPSARPPIKMETDEALSPPADATRHVPLVLTRRDATSISADGSV